jgi:hypothetical protein
MSTIIKIVPIILLGVGGVMIWISFTNSENITGMWVAGKDFRDKEFKDSEYFHPWTYRLIRMIGILLVLSGCAIVMLAK